MRQRRRRALSKGLLAAASARLSALAAALVALLALLALFAPVASAQPAPRELPQLVVQRAPAAADCPDAAALAVRVETLAGKKAFVPAADVGGGFAFEVQILKSDEGYTAIVLAAGKSRQIADPGPTCGSLADALALTLAILVDADEPPPVAPPPPPPPLPPPAPIPTFVPPPSPPPAPRPAPRLLVSPNIGVTEGLSGSLVPALTIGADTRVVGPLSLLAGFTWLPGQDFALSPGRVEVQLMYGQLAACASTWKFLGSVRVGLCAQLNVGGIRGKSIGYPSTREVLRTWTSIGLGGLLDVPIAGPFFWSSRLGVFAVTQQEAFRLDNFGVAFDPPPVGVLVGTGVGVRIF